MDETEYMRHLLRLVIGKWQIADYKWAREFGKVGRMEDHAPDDELWELVNRVAWPEVVK